MDFYKIAKIFIFIESFQFALCSNVFTMGVFKLVCARFLLVQVKIVHFLLQPIKKHFDYI